MRYSIVKAENGYLCVVTFDKRPQKLYVFKKRHEVVEWLDDELE